MYRQTISALILLISIFTVNAEVLPTKLALAKELVTALQVGTSFEAYHTECESSQSTATEAKTAFRSSPGSFGGISPQSTYWSDVEAIYVRFRKNACAHITPEKLLSKYAQIFADESSEAELRAAITFYASPLGKKIQNLTTKVGVVLQKYIIDLTAEAGVNANTQYQIEIQALIKKYKQEPR